MNRNTVELEPDALAFGGKSVGTLPSGKRCFVRGGAPGDRLQVELTAEKKNFAEGVLKKVETPSPDRIIPVCEYARAGTCAGCSYAHVRYETELEWKQKQLERFLVHSGLVESLEEPQGAPHRLGWRNKIKLTAERNGDSLKIGYLMDDNRTVLPIRRCLLARTELQEGIDRILTDEFRAAVPEGRSSLTFRWTPQDGTVLLESDGGPDVLTDTIRPFGDFHVPRDGFFQINTSAMSPLALYAGDLIRENHPDLLIDLYCGCGLFSAVAAENGVHKIFGVEQNPASIDAARLNLQERGLSRCRFLAGDVEDTLPQLPLATAENAMILIDPPRTGMARGIPEQLARSAAKSMIYISCGPDTLARDLKIFTANGWTVLTAKLFDLFPATSHFETVVFLRKTRTK